MILTKVKLLNFRNLEKIELDVSARINIFLGRNGQGKTNLLEGLTTLALGRPHRGGRDRDLIRFGADHLHIAVEGRSAQSDAFRLEMASTQEGRKRIKVDGQPVSRRADLVGRLSVVLFDPEEVDLTKGSPEHRRRFLDYTLSIVSKRYFRHLLAYRRAVAQKNRLLKQRHLVPAQELDVWDEELVRNGSPLMVAREEILPGLEAAAQESHAALAPDGGNLALRIVSKVKGDRRSETEAQEELARALSEGRELERRVGHCLHGPHRDRLEVDLRGRAVRQFGSQGELRSASIALKLAQAEMIYQRTRERPVVFLDDIFSELDRRRSMALQDRLHREHQLFIATARADDVMGMEDWTDLQAWFVEGGRVARLPSLVEGEQRLSYSPRGEKASGV